MSGEFVVCVIVDHIVVFIVGHVVVVIVGHVVVVIVAVQCTVCSVHPTTESKVLPRGGGG